MENRQMTDVITSDPLTVTVPDAMKYSGLGRTKIYELIAKAEIESVRVGTRRLIVFASLKARLTGKSAAANSGSDPDAH
jgi:excisionase family DNA binding protein